MTVRKRALVVPTPRQGSPFSLPQPLPPTPSGKPEPPGHPAARPATSSLQRPAATPRSPYRSASSVSPANGWRFANLSQTRLPGGKPRERRGGSRLRSRLAAATPTAAPPRPSRSVGPAQLSRPTGRVAETAGGGGAHARRGWSRGAKNRKLGDKVRSSAPRVAAPPSGPRGPATRYRPLRPALACTTMSGSSSVTAMKKVVQQLRLEAGLNRVKVSGGGRPRGRGRRTWRWDRRRAGRGGQTEGARRTPMATREPPKLRDLAA